MRMMMKGNVPTDMGNKTFREQTLAPMMQQTMEDLKPEAAYFYNELGRRAFMLVFDMKDTTEIPKVAEPLFHATEAELELMPVMSFDDVMKGMEAAAPKLEKYMK